MELSNYSGPYRRIVMPAKAGIQVLNKLLKIRLKAWMPAFAGMTTWVVTKLRDKMNPNGR